MNDAHDPKKTADIPPVVAETLAPALTEASAEPADPFLTADLSRDSVTSDGYHSRTDTAACDLPAVPGYRVLREIARGGMGRVLAAIDLGLERDVALKILLPRANSDRFVRESKITARLPHPGIPPVHVLGTLADGSPFLAMKLVAGQTLAVEMKTADRPRLLQVFTQVCQAVGFAHSRGIIHRDLKPTNVMVGAFGEVQVMDWGLAKDLSGRELAGEPNSADRLPEFIRGTHPTQTIDYKQSGESTDDQTLAGQVLGTPAYMAPEQARGEPTDGRADVFALGGILCALLTGLPTFRGTSVPEVIRRARDADLAEAHARLDGCGADAEVVALCRQCLSPRPADRPADGQAVADGLMAYLNGVQERLRAAEVARAAETARAEEATERASVERRARRTQVVAASLLLLVLAGGIVGFAWQANIARGQRDRAVYAEDQTSKRADELQKVADYQGKMLQQIDATEAGVKLMADLRARFRAALAKSKAPEAEKQARTAAFERELRAVNATDTAVALLDRTVLAPALRTIEAQFADQPLVDASLRTTLGLVYDSLGRFEEALALYRRAYAVRAASLGEEHPETLVSSRGVGKALAELQQLDQAESTLRETLKACQRVIGEDHEDTLATMGSLGLLLHYRGKFAESEEVYRDALERCRRVLPADHEMTLRTMKDLGGCLMERGKFADAETVLREAVEAQRLLDDPRVAYALSNLGVALHRQKKYAEAEPIMREALERQRRDKGEDYPRTLAAINNLAALLMDRGKLAEAELLAKEALEKCRRVHGDEHSDTLKAMNVMGQVLFNQGKPTETEPYYREALATGRRVLGEEHQDTIIWTANLGFLLRQLGRTAEAEPYLREALAKERRLMGETHPYTLSMTRNLCDLLRDQGKPAEAEVLLRGALKQVQQRGASQPPESLGLIGLLGSVLRDQGKLTEAEPYVQQTLEKTRGLYGDQHANTLLAILRMANLRVAQGKNAEAVALLTPIEGKVRQVFPGRIGSLRYASLLGLLGKARAGLAKEPSEFVTAEANLLEAHATFAKERGEKDKETREWAQALVDFYTARDKAMPDQGYDAKASAWKAKLLSATAPPPQKSK